MSVIFMEGFHPRGPTSGSAGSSTAYVASGDIYTHLGTTNSSTGLVMNTPAGTLEYTSSTSRGGVIGFPITVPTAATKLFAGYRFKASNTYTYHFGFTNTIVTDVSGWNNNGTISNTTALAQVHGPYVRVKIASAGSIFSIMDGSTEVVNRTLTGVITNKEFFLDIEVDFTNKVFKVFVDNAEILVYNFSATLSASAARSTFIQSYYSPSVFFDDIYVADNTGTANNSRIGPVRILQRSPTSDIQVTGFTTPVFSNVGRLFTAAASHTQATSSDGEVLLGCETVSLPGPVLAVRTLIAHMHIQQSGNESIGMISPYVKLGAQESVMEAKATSTSMTFYGYIQERSPFTGQPWTAAEINNTQIGARITSVQVPASGA